VIQHQSRFGADSSFPPVQDNANKMSSNLILASLLLPVKARGTCQTDTKGHRKISTTVCCTMP